MSIDAQATSRPWMIELRGISKSFGEVKALDDVSLSVADGEFFTLLGSSGSGKTTVLRVIAGLLDQDEGDFMIAGLSMTGRPPYERDLAVVFQSLALFPHMSVAENIAFPLRMRRRQQTAIASAVRNALQLVQLPDIGDRKITELSGGQRQRVALARALVYEPRLLLLDEPLSALDRRLREDMQLELARLHRELGVTILNVTHDQREALIVSDRIALMNDGRVLQCGPGWEVYDSPANAFVAAFMGDPLLLTGRITRARGIPEFENKDLCVRVSGEAQDGNATLVLRPESLRLYPAGERPGDADNALLGKVAFTAFDGTGVFTQVALEVGVTLTVHTSRRRGFDVALDDAVFVGWDVGDATILGAEEV